MNREARKYIKECRSCMALADVKKARIHDFIRCVKDSIAENKEITYQQLCETYGNPEDIAASVLNQYDNAQLVHKLDTIHTIKFLKKSIVCLIVAGILCIIGFEFCSIRAARDSKVIIMDNEQNIIEVIESEDNK